MSRHEFSSPEFLIVVGVDNITSVFVQVYDKRTGEVEDKDGADLVVDNQGVREDHRIPELQPYLSQLRRRFKAAKDAKNSHPNLDAETIINIFSALDVPVTLTDIYHILDEPPSELAKSQVTPQQFGEFLQEYFG